MKAAAVLCIPMALTGQDTYFKEPVASPWLPAWELTLRGDRIDDPEEGRRIVERGSARLRLLWSWEQGAWSGALSSWSALGTDGNRFNADRYDQQPSNGTRLDAAWIQVRGASDSGFLELRLGHQENPLLSQESLWDKDLRLSGATLRAAYRGTGRPWPRPKVVDTVELALKLGYRQQRFHPHPQPPPTALPEARERLGLPRYRNHHALSDALATAELFLALRARLGARTLRELS